MLEGLGDDKDKIYERLSCKVHKLLLHESKMENVNMNLC